MSRTRSNRLVIAWMPVSQRSTTLARALGGELMLVASSRGFRRPWTAMLRYPGLALRSIVLLARRRPQAVVVVAPPVFAALLVLPVARLLGARVAIDVHSGALLDRRWRWSVPMLRWLGRHADVTVVTLSSLGVRLGLMRVMVLPDPLPTLTTVRNPAPRAGGQPAVVAVCGWGDDEPIGTLTEAARGRPWTLTLTGRPRRSLSLPPNVRLSGFLDDEAYARLLGDADLIVVLTTRDETLLSGAWEAIALERPLVVSATSALRATFGDSVATAGTDSSSMRRAIEAALDDPDAQTRSRDLRRRFERETAHALRELDDILDGVSGRSAAGPAG